MGGDQPLRVEVDLGHVTTANAAPIAELAKVLSGPKAGERRLEVLSVSVPDEAAIDGLEALRQALTGVDVALDARVARSVWQDRALAARAVAISDRVTPLDPEEGKAFCELAMLVSGHEDHALLVEVDGAGAPGPESPRSALAYRELAEKAARLVEAANGPFDTAHGRPMLVVGLRLPPTIEPIHAWRVLAATLDARGLDYPLLLHGQVRPRKDSGAANAWEDCQVQAALRIGGALVDGIGDAVRIDGLVDAHRAVDLGYGILQGARARTTKTEYISCPSCGRTLFDLETTTATIKGKTDHLKGVKIGIMGCIVNGPGEMADADFGYVGWKPGKVNLYVGKEVVVREVAEDQAADRLVQLIKDHGRWSEP